jgi:hypothetical protein
MKINYVIRFLLFSAIMASCGDDGDLHRTIFIRDKDYRDLPQYSEWGYNTFGAYINDEVFISGTRWDPALLSTDNQTMILSFYGEKISSEKDTTNLMLSFSIPRNSPHDGQYLMALNDTVIDLTNPSTRILIYSDTYTYPIDVSSGELHFRRVQNLLVDNNPEETILSGTFEFEGLMNGNPVSVTHGRFDVGVSSNYY